MATSKASRSRHLSVAVYPLSLGGSNAERLEIEAMFGPPYNAARYGLSLTASPYSADLILLYGSLTEKLAPLVYRLLATLPSDVKLIAVGSEALSTSPFRLFYGVAGPFLTETAVITEQADSTPSSDSEAVAPVKIRGVKLPLGLELAGFIAGSPPDPQTILDGILQILPN